MSSILSSNILLVKVWMNAISFWRGQQTNFPHSFLEYLNFNKYDLNLGALTITVSFTSDIVVYAWNYFNSKKTWKKKGIRIPMTLDNSIML